MSTGPGPSQTAPPPAIIPALPVDLVALAERVHSLETFKTAALSVAGVVMALGLIGGGIAYFSAQFAGFFQVASKVSDHTATIGKHEEAIVEFRKTTIIVGNLEKHSEKQADAMAKQSKALGDFSVAAAVQAEILRQLQRDMTDLSRNNRAAAEATTKQFAEMRAPALLQAGPGFLSVVIVYRIFIQSSDFSSTCMFFIDTLATIMATKNRPGRPPKSSDRLKSESVLVRVEPAEKRAFGNAAELAGMPVSAWVRDRLRAAARRELIESGRPVPFYKPH